jgi:hypothetical protein
MRPLRIQRPTVSIPNTPVPASGPQTPISPMTPSVAQPPSPTVIKRRQLNKLCRVLGERVPYELLFKDEYGMVDLAGMVKLIGSERHESQSPLEKEGLKLLRQSLGLTKGESFLPISELQGESDDEGESERRGGQKVEGAEEWRRGSSELVTQRGSNANRYSRKWIREKGGNRWVEEDYQDVLRSLRKL